MYLAQTWGAQASFEESLNFFKQELSKHGEQAPPELIKHGEKLEQSSIELKEAVTNAIKSIEQTKLQIIKILGV